MDITPYQIVAETSENSKEKKTACLKCESLPNVKIGDTVSYNGFVYKVKDSHTLDSLIPIESDAQLANFAIATKNQNVDIHFSKDIPVIDTVVYNRPEIELDFKFSDIEPLELKKNGIITYMLYPEEIEKFPDVPVGSDVAFRDKFNNLLVGKVVNSTGTIEVNYSEIISDNSNYKTNDRRNYISSLHPKIETIYTDWIEELQENIFPDTSLDTFNTSNDSIDNFIYLENGIMKTANPETEEAFVHKMFQTSYIDPIFVGQVVETDEGEYLLTSSTRAMDLTPSHKIIDAHDKPYSGSQLQLSLEHPVSVINFDELLLTSITETLNDNGQNRVVLEFPDSAEFSIWEAIVENSTRVPKIGDLVQINLNDLEETKLRFIIADSTHLIAAFDDEPTKQLLNYELDYKTNILQPIKILNVYKEPLEELKTVCGEKFEIVYTKNMPNSNDIYTPFKDLTLHIMTDSNDIAVKFAVKFDIPHDVYLSPYHDTLDDIRGTVYIMPIQDEVYKQNKSLIESCLTSNLKSISGSPELQWSYTTNIVNLQIPNNQIHPDLYSIKNKDGIISLNNLTTNSAKTIKPEERYVKYPFSIPISFTVSEISLPRAAIVRDSDKTICINGMQGKLTSHQKNRPDGLPSYEYRFEVAAKNLMKTPNLDGEVVYKDYEKFTNPDDVVAIMKSIFKTVEQRLDKKILNTGLISKMFGREDIPTCKWRLEETQKGKEVVLRNPTTKIPTTQPPQIKESKVISIPASQSKNQSVNYQDLRISEITIPNEKDIAKIPSKYLARDVGYWVESETQKLGGVANIAFAMGKIIGEDGKLLDRDVVMDAEVFPIIKANNLRQLGFEIGNVITIDAGNNMKDYYTMVAQDTLLRNSSIGRAQLSNNFVLPDIAQGSTISTYSQESPVAKLIKDYVQKLENDKEYIIEQKEEPHNSLNSPQISVSPPEQNNAEPQGETQNANNLQKSIDAEKRNIEELQKLLKESLDRLESLLQEAESIKRNAGNILYDEKHIIVFGRKICSVDDITNEGGIAYVNVNDDVKEMLKENPAMRDELKNILQTKFSIQQICLKGGDAQELELQH